MGWVTEGVREKDAHNHASRRSPSGGAMVSSRRGVQAFSSAQEKSFRATTRGTQRRSFCADAFTGEHRPSAVR